MDTYNCFNYYTQFVNTWKDYRRPSTLITKGFLDTESIQDINCVIYQLLPSTITDDFIEALTSNLENPQISRICIITSKATDLASIIKNDKLNVIRLTFVNEIQYSHVFRYMDRNEINIFLYDYIVIDPNESHLLKSIKKNQIAVLSASTNITSEFNGFVVNGAPEFKANYYINMYGSLNLVIRKFYMNSYKIVNLSTIISFTTLGNNIDLTLNNHYINLPTFLVIFSIPQNKSIEFDVDIDKLLDTLVSDTTHSHHSIDPEFMYKNLDDFIPILNQLELAEIENRIKSSIYFKCKYDLNQNRKSIEKAKKDMEDDLKEKMTGFQKQRQKIIDDSIESYRLNVLNQIDSYKKINMQIINDELEVYKATKEAELDLKYTADLDKKLKELNDEIDAKRNQEEIAFQIHVKDLYENKYTEEVENMFNQNLKKKNEQIDEIAKSILERKIKEIDVMCAKKLEEKEIEYQSIIKAEELRIKQKIGQIEIQERVKLNEYMENVKEIESKKLIALVEDHLREYKDLEKERINEQMFTLRKTKEDNIEKEFENKREIMMGELNKVVAYYKNKKTRRTKWWL
jgi:hypothetical protein